MHYGTQNEVLEPFALGDMEVRQHSDLLISTEYHTIAKLLAFRGSLLYTIIIYSGMGCKNNFINV